MLWRAPKWNTYNFLDPGTGKGGEKGGKRKQENGEDEESYNNCAIGRPIRSLL